jgi:hypothetical protein
VRIEQALLALDADLVEQDVALISQQLVVVHSDQRFSQTETPVASTGVVDP